VAVDTVVAVVVKVVVVVVVVDGATPPVGRGVAVVDAALTDVVVVDRDVVADVGALRSAPSPDAQPATSSAATSPTAHLRIPATSPGSPGCRA